MPVLSDESAKWLDEFKSKHGRAPKILHIGNIANNAYLNAKMLNDAGCDCDVLCNDYYHIMGCPEWEDADFDGDFLDQFYPAWQKVNLNGFKRPEWFTQGPARICIKYLIAKNIGFHSSIFWKYMNFLTRQICTFTRNRKRLILSAAIIFIVLTCSLIDFQNIILEHWKIFLLPAIMSITVTLMFSYHILGKNILFLIMRLWQPAPTYFLNKTNYLAKEMNTLFSFYDVVIGYSTAGVYPMIAGKRPYLAYEHGTIRNIPFEDNLQGRFCADTYKKADFCFITNCDNVRAAKKLELEKYCFIPHPVNENITVEDDCKRLREDLCAELNTDFIVFHPARQHWDERRHPDWEKGNDFFIKGLAKFIDEINPRASAVFVEWGSKVNESKKLIEDLGISSRVKWIKPIPNIKMIKYIKAADILADQFYLGAFGSTIPKALLHGIPSLIYINEDLHKWCFNETPPVMNVQTPEEIFIAMKKLYESSEFRKKVIQKGSEWYIKYHSNKVIVNTMVRIFSSVIGARYKK